MLPSASRGDYTRIRLFPPSNCCEIFRQSLKPIIPPYYICHVSEAGKNTQFALGGDNRARRIKILLGMDIVVESDDFLLNTIEAHS
jgi:hypothetical protein